MNFKYVITRRAFEGYPYYGWSFNFIKSNDIKEDNVADYVKYRELINPILLEILRNKTERRENDGKDLGGDAC